MRRVILMLVILAGVWSPSGAHAQVRSLALRSPEWPAWSVPQDSAISGLSIPKAQDYRWEGVIVGGALVGIGAGVLAYGLCSENEPSADGGGSCVGRSLLGALLGAGVGVALGGLVGGLIPKGE